MENLFNYNWELCKLGRVVERVTRKNKELKSTLPLTISAQEGLIDQNVFFNKSVASRDVSGYYLIYNGEFAYNKSYSNGYPWGAIKRLNRYDMGVLSTLYIIFKPKNIDSNFLEKYYDTSCWYHEVSKHAAEGARNHGLLNIAASDFLRTELTVPKSVEEQRKIGNFLKQLDDTITLHQRKLEQLKELKKAYLQLMFASTNTKNDKLPKLRFTGFKGYWELCKLSDISDKVKEKNKHGKFTETLTNSAEYGIINQRVFFDKDISNVNNLNSYYVVQNDDFVYNPRISNFAPVGPIKRNRLGRTGVMSPLYYVFRTHSIDNNYLEKYFDTVYWHHFMELNGDTGARADRFAIKDSIFVEMPIPYPSTEEQQKIGIFFKKLDQSITLYKNKLNQLKALKKAYLQNMFI
ncbi:restriction endonuclease subunit S [Enterococcus faecalis]|uniref:restriction endonuclease subunit S n=1 Tax=Enterococcus faecalis TaxID=1351 RepID=UPI0019255FB2|nr:restriction endonuclease subunit S [Enterococcus faecalis]EIQ7064309.1 restriction endonuclease subunit S [Enterococcus faecalis]